MRTLHLETEVDDGLFVVRTETTAYYFKPEVITLTTAPPPNASRIVAYSMLVSTDNVSFVSYKRPVDPESLFCFLLSRYTCNVKCVSNMVRDHFLKSVYSGKRLSPVDYFMDELSINNTHSQKTDAGVLCQFLHQEKIKEVNGVLTVVEPKLIFQKDNEKITQTTTVYARDYSWCP